MTFSLVLVLTWASACFAISLTEYREHVKKAISALEWIHETEQQLPSERDAFVAANLRVARTELPSQETVEWNGTTFNVDNSWFEKGVLEIEKVAGSAWRRAPLLDQTLEQLQALQARLDEIEKAVPSPAPGKGEMRDRLAANLQRAEFAKPVKEESALQRVLRQVKRVLRQLVEWLANLFPNGRSPGQGASNLASRVALIFVLVVALAAIAYVLRKFAPHFLRGRKKKKSKPQARVVLGERLEPDKSAADLLAEAEALARAGDLRGAIRRGYIALLIELADRKIISLAQHKTNRDYLRAVKGIRRLHQNMEALTNNFEQHWYGLEPASENDWMAFRAGYKEAITAR
ncbi:MAG: DUF4129 domain-containing protein [Acidobacteriota bacterium]|nr:DUF4129 domain-containing protein [Acidobacteriota bacterium]